MYLTVVSHHLLFSIESELGVVLIPGHLKCVCLCCMYDNMFFFITEFRNKLFLLNFSCLSWGKTNVRGGVYRIGKEGVHF